MNLKAPKLTRSQAAIIGAYTGYMCGPPEDLLELASDLFGRPVTAEELTVEYSAAFLELRRLVKPRFMEIAATRGVIA